MLSGDGLRSDLSKDNWLHTEVGCDNKILLVKSCHRFASECIRDIRKFQWNCIRFLFIWFCLHLKNLLMMHDKEKTMIVSFDTKFIRPDQKHVGLARQALPFLRCFWSQLINLIPKDTNTLYSMFRTFMIGGGQQTWSLSLRSESSSDLSRLASFTAWLFCILAFVLSALKFSVA